MRVRGAAALTGRLALACLSALGILLLAGAGAAAQSRPADTHLSQAADFGDAPEPLYATLLSHNGAYHLITTGGPLLGSTVDAEPDGQPTADATGDDVNPAGQNDEDGVTWHGALVAGQPYALEVVVQNPDPGQTAYLRGWIDWNGDGTWDSAGELPCYAEVAQGGSPLTCFLMTPPGARPGLTFARFRVSHQAAFGPTGGLPDGEVEDYAVTVVGPATNTPTATPTPSPTPTLTATVSPCIDAYEPDNDPAHAHLFAMDGHGEQHTLHAANDDDWLRIQAQAGREYTLTTSRLAGGADTNMYVWEADLTTVAGVSEDIHFPDNLASQVVWTATYNGPYYARIRDFYRHGGCPLGYTITGLSAPGILHLWLPLFNRWLATPTPPPTATTTATSTPTTTPTPTPTSTSTPGVIVLPAEVPLRNLAHPNALAVDPNTHLVYITSRDTNRVIVMDGATLQKVNETGTGSQPWGIVENPATGKVYVGNFGSGDVDVLSASSLAHLARLPLGAAEPALLALNPATNRIFVASHSANQVTVIDGNTDSVEARPGTGGLGAWGIAANPALNRVYVGHRDSSTLVTLDGNNGYSVIESQTARPCGVDGSLYSLAFNPANSKLYVACAPDHGSVNTAVVYHAGSAGLIWLATLAIDNGGNAGGGGIGIDAASGNAFITNLASDSVSVLGGLSNSVRGTVVVGAGPFGIAVDPGLRRVFAGDGAGDSIYVFTDIYSP